MDVMSVLGAGINLVSQMSPGTSQQPDINSQLAQLMLAKGSSVINDRVAGWFSWLSLDALRPLFHVSNSYVLRKIGLVLLPFTHKDWTRKRADPQLLQQQALAEVQAYQSAGDMAGVMRVLQRQQQQQALLALNNGYNFPIHDINAPDLYLPLMSFITFVLLCGYTSGLADRFHPEVLASRASVSFVVALLQLAVARALFFTAGAEHVRVLELAALLGYQYLGYIVAIIFGLVLAKPLFFLLVIVVTTLHAFHVMFATQGAWAEELGADGPNHPWTGRKRTVAIGLLAMQVVFGLLLLRQAVPDSVSLSGG